MSSLNLVNQLPLRASSAAPLIVAGRRGYKSVRPILNLDIAINLARRARRFCFHYNLDRAQRRKLKRDAIAKADTEFGEALDNHHAIMSATAGEVGNGEICAECSMPIHDILCRKRSLAPLHWSCAGCPRPQKHAAVLQRCPDVDIRLQACAQVCRLSVA